MAKDDNPFFDLAGSEIRSIPQSELEKFIGSFGKRAESLGKSMAEPLTETKKVAPIKSFLAQMLITDPLQSAGTALQDWSHTPRENTSERPYTPSPFYGGSPATLNPNTWGPALQTFRTDPRVADVAVLAEPLVFAIKPAATAARAAENATVGALQRARIARAAEQARRTPEAVYNPLRERLENQGSLQFAVKPKGGNWAPPINLDLPSKRSAGSAANSNSDSVTRALSPLRTYYQGPNRAPAEIESLNANVAEPLNRWLDKKLAPYVRNEMGTPDDPIRLMHELGYTHSPAIRGMEENVAGTWTSQRVADARSEAGFPEEGFAVRRHAEAGYPEENLLNTRRAEEWETLSDSAIDPNIAGNYQEDIQLGRQRLENRKPEFKSILGDWDPNVEMAEKNPWIEKLDPNTPIYRIADSQTFSSDLDFNHLMDELRASLSPNSELPAHLRLTPETLNKVSVADAVKRVSEINDWRALEAAKAEQAGMMENLSSNARLVDPTAKLSFVEKPGLTWADIPEVVDEKGTKLCTSIGKAGGWCTMNADTAQHYGSGNARLTALLDAEGRPHAQAMIVKSTKSPYDEWFDKNGGDIKTPEVAEFLSWVEARAKAGGSKMNSNQLYLDWAAETGRPIVQPTQNIEELKPPGNAFSSDRSEVYKKRDPDYQKKISESVVKFLNSGDWGIVNDLYLYNIFDLRDPSSYGGLTRLFGEEGADKVFAATRANGGTPPVRFMTRDQVKDFIEQPEIVYHAGAEFNEPRPGLFTHPEREVVEKFQSSTNAPQLHTFEARPRSSGTEEDVYRVARQLGIYDPEIPVGQYLEQGENAIFPQSAQVVEELRNLGFDSLRLQDAMSKKPSLVALDPSVLRRVPPAEGYAEGGAVHMQAGGVASLARRLFKTPVAELGRAGTMSKAGARLSETFSPEDLENIQNSRIVMRRGALADIAGPDKRLKSVHETNRTGAAVGPLRSKQVRAEREPEMFGDIGQTYGYLTLDPLSTLKLPFEVKADEKLGVHIRPQSYIPQYGRFGLELHPGLRDRATFTINDSLDRTLGPKVDIDSILRPSGPTTEVAVPGSRLHDLALGYDATMRNIVARLQSQGFQGQELQKRLSDELAKINAPGSFAELLRSEGLAPIGGSSYSRLPAQIPRRLSDPTETPLLPSEIYSLGDEEYLYDKLLQRIPKEYVEVQMHGDITPEHIRRIYDFGYEPSLQAEKQAKKLGIEYAPRPEAAYDIIKREKPKTLGEFFEMAEELGVAPENERLRHSVNRMLPFKGNYAKGGAVNPHSTNPFDHLV